MRRDAFIKGLPFILFVLFLVPILVVTLTINRDLEKEEEDNSSTTIVEHYENSIPVISENNYIGSPYIDPEVQVGKKYYDYEGDEQSQENALVQEENTYYQNMGIDYVKNDPFDVITVADGTVTLVKEDDLVGKTVEIEHKNGLITIYQSLSEIHVKKGDMVTQGQTIGKSGTNEMDKELGNHLHFEIYENGSFVNPENYINKDYKKEN